MNTNIHSGVIRRVDDLGRIVIPKEIRRRMNIHEGDPIEIALVHADDGTPIIALSRYANRLQREGRVCECALKSVNAPKDCAVSIVDERGHFVNPRFVTGAPKAVSSLFGYESKIANTQLSSTDTTSIAVLGGEITTTPFTYGSDIGFVTAYIPSEASALERTALRNGIATVANFITNLGVTEN